MGTPKAWASECLGVLLWHLLTACQCGLSYRTCTWLVKLCFLCSGALALEHILGNVAREASDRAVVPEARSGQSISRGSCASLREFCVHTHMRKPCTLPLPRFMSMGLSAFAC